MAEITFLPAAITDYEDALAWYDERSPQAAAAFEAAVEVALRAIRDSPGRSPLRDDRHRFCMLRKYPYSIVYRLEAEDVLVVAVAHSHREASYWQDRT